MRIVWGLILAASLISVPVAHAGAPCAGHTQWPSITTSDEAATVQIWYPEPQRNTDAHVYAVFKYKEPINKTEGACIMIAHDPYADWIYPRLTSTDADKRSEARYMIEVWGIARGVLKELEPLGD